MAGSTITVSVGQFAQQLRQKYPQYGSVPDDKLIAAFLSKNPKYTGNYEGVTLVSVSFEPAAADAAAEKPDVTSSIQSQPVTSPEMPYLGSTVIVNVPAVPAPPMIGKYEIIEELGRGAMGLVYKAFDTGIGRTVALKVMSEQLACDTEFRSRFLREARGAGILQHPNIVTVYELGEWQGAPFIAMEFLEGRSLEDILKNAKTTPLEKRLDIMVQVCRGLDYAHARGVVHRDIKPANVMVTTDGVAKVVDFGIARLADQKLTQVGQVLGTVSYMSPEQLQGKALDGRSDIFAVGVMLFEALTSVLPFAAENTGSAVTNILYRQPPSLSKFLTNYPGELDDVLKKCLAKDPTERLQTAGELADKLSRVQQELQRAQTAPTVIRSTSGAANPSNLQTPSLSDATRQLSQAALQSVDSAKEWWKVASPESRAKAITIAIPILLYLQALIAPSGGFSDTRLGGGFVTSSTIVLPVAILSAVVISIGVWGQRWKDSPSNVKVFVGAVGFIVVAFCADKIALGLMWYLIVSKTFLVLVLALLGIYAWTNISFALDLWRRGSGKERAISALGIVLLAGVFLTTLSWNLIDYAKNWGSTPKSYFAQGGEFEKKEHAAGRATVYDKESTPAPTPNYPTFDLVQTLAGNAATNPESNEGATHFETAVAFSPNGNLIASGDWGGTLRIWDAASGQLMHTITGLFNIKFLSFSPDGRWIVAPMVDRKIGVWDVATATLARTVAGGGDCVAFDSTGKWLATTNGGNIVNIWDPATGKLLKTFDAQAGVFSMAFAPGNPFPPYNGTPQRPTVLATGGGDGAVRLWDGENGKLLQTLTGHRGWVSSLAFTSYDLAALGYEDGELRVWSIPSGELEHIISAPATSIVFFGTDNYMLTAGTGDGTVRFWDAHTGAELRPLQAHTQQVNSVAISPNGRWLATASKDKTTKVWKLK